MTLTIERRVIAGEEEIPILLLSSADRPEAPLVFFQHGYNSRKEDALPMLLDLAERGYRIVCLDARWHGARRLPDFEARFGADFPGSFLRVVEGTARDVTTVMDALGAREAGFIGVSMGAYIAYWSVPREPRLQSVVALIGSPGFVGEIPDRPEMAAFMQQHGPIALAGRFPPRALLMINGELDEVVAPEGARRLYAALRPLYTDAPDRLVLRLDPLLGHAVTPEMWRDSFAWIERYLPAA
jgi:pimeloyl-ACP methyl ester carboxylesterase